VVENFDLFMEVRKEALGVMICWKNDCVLFILLFYYYYCYCYCTTV